jgi:hypothetical protein
MHPCFDSLAKNIWSRNYFPGTRTGQGVSSCPAHCVWISRTSAITVYTVTGRAHQTSETPYIAAFIFVFVLDYLDSQWINRDVCHAQTGVTDIS